MPSLSVRFFPFRELTPITTREVKGIDQTVSLNRALWNAAESLMQLQSA